MKMLKFNELGDNSGSLVAIEGNKTIPFEIKRIFYIYGTKPDVVRGKHANRNSEFILINIAGISTILINDGSNKEIFKLDKPNNGLYIPKMVWKEMYNFSVDSVLLCISSEPYDESEYIRNYDDFLSEVNKDNV